MRARIATAGLAMLCTALSGQAWGKPLDAAGLKTVRSRLEVKVSQTGKMTVPAGETHLVEVTLKTSGSISKPAASYEAIVSGVRAPKGVKIHPRADEFKIVGKGRKASVIVRYAVHVPAGRTAGGGRTEFTVKLNEREGLGVTAASKKVKTWIKIVPAKKVTEADLIADFWGYRHFAKRATKASRLFKKVNIDLPLEDRARITGTNRLKPAGFARVVRFVADRRRMWIAERHLQAASRGKNGKLAALANKLLQKKNEKESALAGIPDLDAAATAEPPPPAVGARQPPPPETGVETLAPVGETNAGGGSNVTDDGSVSPISSYEFGSEAERQQDLPTSRRPGADVPPPPPADPVTAVDPNADPKQSDPDAEDGDLTLVTDGFGGTRLRRLKYIKGFPRGLVLEDANIGFGAGSRIAWANVSLDESAMAPAFFFFGQVAITPKFGVELTVPTEFVKVDLADTRSVFAMGNPLVTAKFRLFLPKILTRRPALTFRARYGLPLSPLNAVPPTTIEVESFTQQAHFTDPYAFQLEKHALGGGASMAWKHEWIAFGAQLFFDYFTPVGGSIDPKSFASMSYGVSVGALPFGDIVGAYLEARSTSLFVGPIRTEFFTYAGVRGRLLDIIEPAIWISLPLGSVQEATGVQFGGEIRISFDTPDVENTGKSQSERLLLQ